MSTVKISQLPNIPGGLNANTSNSLFLGVDIPTGITGKFTATQLAERLYANNVLNVGDNPVVFPNVVAQFAGDAEAYLQVNLLNSVANGSADYVVTADIGTDTTYYIDLGINNSNYSTNPLDGYVLVAGDGTSDPGGNLMLGSITSGKQIEFVLGGFEQANVVARMIDGTGFRLVKKPIIFADGTSQNTAAVAADYSQGSFAAANTAGANTVAINTLALAAYGKANAEGQINVTQNTNISSVNTYASMASFTANSGWTSANAGVALATAAYAQANNASSNTVYLQTINDLQNTNIASVNTFTQAAFTKANNSLANTSGTFAGDLTVAGNVTVLGTTSSTGPITTGNLIVSGTSTLTGNVSMIANTYMTGAVTVNSTMVLANSNFSTTEAAFTITAAGSSQTPTQAGTLMQLTSKANTPARVLIDSFGTSNTAYPVIAGRAARGTVSAPTPTQNNDILLRIAGNSYGTTGYAPFGDARIDFVASENHSDTNRGSRIRFWNTPNGSNVVNEIASFNADSVYFTGTVAPQKGFIHTPNVQSTLTTLNIDFDRDSFIKFNVNDNATITLSNFVYGKVVEVWITNSAAQNKTITHGCFANNSTEHSTTFTIIAESCAYLRYFSIDGDLANTFVSITA